MKKTNAFLCIASIVAMVFFTIFAGSVYALPALQLGPGTGNWSYDTSTQTWVVSESSFGLNAYANAHASDGGNGDYAWVSNDIDVIREAYLVVSAVPKNFYDTDVFNITISDDNETLAREASGFGTPPASDPNALAPHGIFDNYYEIYKFVFDGGLGTINDTQYGKTGSGQGYTETFGVNINWLAEGVSGVHFDLYTLSGDNVYAFAPYSHDAESAPVPEPATMLLLGTGLIGLAGIGRKFKT